MKYITNFKSETELLEYLKSNAQEMKPFFFQKGLYFKKNNSYVYLTYVNNTLQHPFRRVFKCKAQKENDSIVLDGNFKFKTIPMIFFLVILSVLLYGNWSLLGATTLLNQEKALVQFIFIVLYLVIALLMFSGKLFFGKEEKCLVEIIKKW
ncbi:MAG: hypothetical protein IJE10_07535 [Clostridia bacterium]|nr:hypothetical protein [Clostridia bacterium]